MNNRKKHVLEFYERSLKLYFDHTGYTQEG